MNINTNINYNSNFVTTYKTFDKQNYATLCYQIQILQAFNMKKYDINILQENIKNLNYLLKNNIIINKILVALEKNNNYFFEIPQENKDMFFFQLLFSYDYFDIFHKCFTNYLNNEKDFNELLSVINSK